MTRRLCETALDTVDSETAVEPWDRLSSQVLRIWRLSPLPLFVVCGPSSDAGRAAWRMQHLRDLVRDSDVLNSGH